MLIQEILKESKNYNVSDIILSPESYASFKINWDIFKVKKFDILKKDTLDKEILELMNEKQRKEFLEKLEIDFSIQLEWISRYRVNCLRQKNGLAIVFRPIKENIPEFEELWLPNSILKTIWKINWLFLVTWSVWSWKSTTLASLLNYINKNFAKHIITIEDPIEFIYKNEKSLVEQREVWEDTLSFDNWLKYCLRQASDVIMIWEMTDLETFRLALRAAETWNLVFATLHTSWAARAIARIVDMFPWSEKEHIKTQLSESLLWVLWQDLIKAKDGKGRVAAVEFMVNTTWIKNIIRKWANHQIDWMIETWNEHWMVTMKKSLEKLIEGETIDKEIYNSYLQDLIKINE